jgi:hypothetical protein
VEALLGRYARWLAAERGLAETTIRRNVELVRPFVADWERAGRVEVEHLRAADVTAFVVARCQNAHGGTAPQMVTALTGLPGSAKQASIGGSSAKESPPDAHAEPTALADRPAGKPTFIPAKVFTPSGRWWSLGWSVWRRRPGRLSPWKQTPVGRCGGSGVARSCRSSLERAGHWSLPSWTAAWRHLRRTAASRGGRFLSMRARGGRSSLAGPSMWRREQLSQPSPADPNSTALGLSMAADVRT